MVDHDSGKSTIVHLFQKFHEQESGNVFINEDIPLSTISTDYWRGIACVVPQNNHLFNGTVLENIAFEDSVTNPSTVITFLKGSGSDFYFESLPQSLFTLAGEEGMNLSGGQRQLIALSCVLNHHPQLLVLDEATSSMYRDTELFG
jgi:ATP-binding cassette subfamily B protein